MRQDRGEAPNQSNQKKQATILHQEILQRGKIHFAKRNRVGFLKEN